MMGGEIEGQPELFPRPWRKEAMRHRSPVAKAIFIVTPRPRLPDFKPLQTIA
jgi:hypothetical protein